MPLQIALTAALLTAGLLPGQQTRPNRPSPGSSVSSNSIYTNSSYAFTCKVPVGWVLRTDEMNAGNDPAKSQVLLAAFERPPEASGGEPASAIVIAMEPRSTYPALKTPEDYFVPLAEVVTAKGFEAVNDPYPFPLGTTKIMRQDFSREQKDRPTIYQSTLVILSRGSILSFTFVATSEDEIDSVIENLSFHQKSAPKSAPVKKEKVPKKHPS